MACLKIKSRFMALGLSVMTVSCYNADDANRAKCSIFNAGKGSDSHNEDLDQVTEIGFDIFEGTVVSKKVSSSKMVEAEMEISWAAHDVVEVGAVVLVQTSGHNPDETILDEVDLEVGKHYRIAAIREDDATETWKTESWFGVYDTENGPVCD